VVDYAKAHPGELSMGSNKVGSIHHRMQTALFHKLGINIRFIPYKGTGRVVKDILGHHLPVGMAQPGLWAPHVKAGKAKVLLLLNDKRIPQMPNVPIPSDLGIKLDLPTQFQALVVRKETPEDRVKFIAAAFHKVMGTQAYKDYIKRAKGGQIPLWSDDTEELGRNFRAQIKEARKFMLENGILKK